MDLVGTTSMEYLAQAVQLQALMENTGSLLPALLIAVGVVLVAQAALERGEENAAATEAVKPGGPAPGPAVAADDAAHIVQKPGVIGPPPIEKAAAAMAWWPSLACCYAARGDDAGLEQATASLGRAAAPPAVATAPLDASPGATEDASAAAARRAAALRAGVAEEAVGLVAALAREVGARADRHEEGPLADPTTLWRFLSAREMDVEAAAAMYRKTLSWRAGLPVAALMAQHGGGERYGGDGGERDPAADLTSWGWKRRIEGTEAALIQDHGFWGRLDCYAPADGAPIAVWRPGAADIEGYLREDLFPMLIRGFIAFLEDLLQSGRAASRLRRKLVRARLVVDAKGLGLARLRHVRHMQRFMEIGKEYFPEVTASMTVIRAPRSFTTVYGAVQPLLTPAMRRKVRILGEDFEAGLREHAGIDRSCLPEFLGGARPNDEVCRARPLPAGIGDALRAAL